MGNLIFVSSGSPVSLEKGSPLREASRIETMRNAEKIRPFVNKFGQKKIYSSTALYAIETAKIISARLCGGIDPCQQGELYSISVGKPSLLNMIELIEMSRVRHDTTIVVAHADQLSLLLRSFIERYNYRPSGDCEKYLAAVLCNSEKKVLCVT